MPVSPCPASLLDHFCALRDPREGWRVLYLLPEVLLLVLCATLSGMEDFVEIRLWGGERLDFLRRFLAYERGLPSHDTLNDIVNALDADLFKVCFANWVEALRDGVPDIVAIDGKTSDGRPRGAPTRAEKGASRCIWCRLGRRASGSCWDRRRSAENPTRSPLFRCCSNGSNWRARSSPSTPSAHRAPSPRRSCGAAGDYLLALKGNQPVLQRDAVAFFDDPPADMVEPVHETTDGDHGRIEVRRHVVCHDVGWMFPNRGRAAGQKRFPGAAMIGMVESRVERDGGVARERRYYISSAKLDAKTFAAAVRAHWGVENALHWVLDVVFHDDLSRLRTGNGPQNMAVVKHMAMNLVRNPKDRHSFKNRRKLANLNPDYLESLFDSPPR